MKKKSVPLRMCVGCGEMKQKIELIRVVKNNSNEVLIDLSGKMNGRGAYVCKNTECINLVKKNKRLDRTFGVSIGVEKYRELYSNVEEK